jgi:D-glycero-D-manno-heptose 1,7-bisphosphate phosphatase
MGIGAPVSGQPESPAAFPQPPAPNSQPPLQGGVFLDRDGVLNQAVIRDGKPYPPAAAEDIEIVADAPAALERLKAAGLPLIVVTNQPDVARGIQTAEAVHAIHDRIRRELPVDDVLSCFHDDADECPCRKPKPGLILVGAEKYGIDPRRSFMIGDRWRDVDAGKRAGCRTIWIDRGYRERAPSQTPDARVCSLNEAVTWILQQVDSEKNGT